MLYYCSQTRRSRRITPKLISVSVKMSDETGFFFVFLYVFISFANAYQYRQYGGNWRATSSHALPTTDTSACLRTNTANPRGVATGGISGYIPPTQSTFNFLCLVSFSTPKQHNITGQIRYRAIYTPLLPNQIPGYASGKYPTYVNLADLLTSFPERQLSWTTRSPV